MCSCDMGDAVAMQTTRTVKARKPHYCCECRRRINVGEVYHYQFCRFAHSNQTGECRVCPHCLAAREILKEITGCDCWVYGDLLETLQDKCATGGYYSPRRVSNFRLARLYYHATTWWTALRLGSEGPLT